MDIFEPLKPMSFIKSAEASFNAASVRDDSTIIALRIRAFDGGHAIVIYPNHSKNPLVRIHSECFTGDIFGSKQCDCGDQLRITQARMEEEGGIIVYLRQEGRGVGLVEKIKSYALQQDEGIDTFEAGRELGHEDDARDFTIAAAMLDIVGIKQCRLMTNNEDKALALEVAGIKITEVIPMPATKNPHNLRYIEAKHRRGHKGLLPA